MVDTEVKLNKSEFPFLEKFFRDENATLKRDDASPEAVAAITGLQQFLHERGLYKKSIDGDFGRGTEAAVKAFQEQNGITPTGIVDQETFITILREHTVAHAADPRASEMEAAFDTQRQAVFTQIEHAVNRQNGAVRKDGFWNFFHNFGVSAEITTYRIPQEVKEAILQGDGATFEGVNYDFSRDVMTDPKKLKTEMQKLAVLCSGGQDVPDFTQEANGNASISRHVEASGPIKVMNLLIKR